MFTDFPPLATTNSVTWMCAPLRKWIGTHNIFFGRGTQLHSVYIYMYNRCKYQKNYLPVGLIGYIPLMQLGAYADLDASQFASFAQSRFQSDDGKVHAICIAPTCMAPWPPWPPWLLNPRVLGPNRTRPYLICLHSCIRCNPSNSKHIFLLHVPFAKIKSEMLHWPTFTPCTRLIICKTKDHD